MAQIPEQGMDGRLQSLLVDKRQAFLEWLQGLGVQTCSDLRGIWSGGGSMGTLSLHHATATTEAFVG